MFCGNKINKGVLMHNNKKSYCLLLMIIILNVWILINKFKERKIIQLKKRVDVLADHFQLLNHWLETKSEGKSVISYFEDRGYYHIAIYGMAELANRLSEELTESSIHIDYGIDRDICCSSARIDKVYFPEDNLPETDVIIVTPYSSFEMIKKILEKKVSCPIVSLEEVIWSI